MSVASAFRRDHSVMKYAVIRTGGKQYRVTPGDVIRIEKLSGEIGSPVEFADVLLAADDDSVEVGRPVVAGLRVRAEIVAQGKDDLLQEFLERCKKGPLFAKITGFIVDEEELKTYFDFDVIH